MSIFILSASREGDRIVGTVQVTRTTKLYDFILIVETGFVKLEPVTGGKAVSGHHLLDVREFVRGNAASMFGNDAPDVVSAPTESELRATTDAELPPVTHSLVETAHVSVTIPDARPVLYFEQDGGHFCYRDRPFYYVDFDYVGPDGMSAGVCPSFSTVAPFRVADFDMEDARCATAWFTKEAAKAGFRVERAPLFRDQSEVPCHPDEELADLAFVRSRDDQDESASVMTVAEFVVYRATPQAPVVRETFDTFEPWSKAYLNLIENWYGVDVATHAAELCEEYYTESLTPIAAANKYVSVYITAG